MRNVRYRYPNTGEEWVLQQGDLSLDDGEYVCVFGASGSGKSTLAYLFNGLIPHFFDGTLEGSVEVEGRETREVRVSDLFNHVGMVLQNADAHLFNSTVENEIAFGLESLGLSGDEIDRRIHWVTKTLEIEDFLGRSPTALSGGEKRLISIASVLCLNPSVVVLDEPYAHLDWEGVRRVREALSKIHQMGKTIVVIEQRIGGFLHDATRCIIMERGRPLFDGSPKGALKILARDGLLPRYQKRKKRHQSGKENLLSARDISYVIEKQEILKGVSFELRRGETVAIVGRNGSGKTTLIKHFNGLLRPVRGEVIFMGEVNREKAPSEMASSVGLSFQNANDQFFKSRVREELLAGPEILGRMDNGWIEELYDLFELHGLLDRSPYRLSEGEKKRVAIASILAHQPPLLVLDEPTVGQDGRFREALVGLLNALEERGFTTVIVTHDLEFAEATADRWIVLHEGKIVADGSPRAVRHDEELIRLGAIGRPEQETIAGFF
jgi:energy-coupling factor transport system ATP-binding protein